MSEGPKCVPKVVVSAPGVEALAEPKVILHIDGVYYVTLACWGYDPHALGLTGEQREAVKIVEEMFKDSKEVEARILSGENLTVFCSAHSVQSGAGLPPTSPPDAL
jgi:hypothetical protein